MNRSRAGFSLVEIMVVICLVVTIVGMIAPSLTGMGKSNSLTHGGNLLSNSLMLARQNAMSRGALTALVMATEGEDSHRAFAVFELAPRADGSTLKSSDWKQVSQWEKLPVGVVSQSDPFEGAPAEISPDLPELKCGGKMISNFKYVVFQPNGGLFKATQPARIELVEGVWQGDTLQSTHLKDGQAANFYELYVLPASGKTKLNRP